MMRRLAYPAAVLLLVASATVANAGAGLPKLGTFEAGSYKAAVHIDSHVPQVGTNVFTVESANIPEGAHVDLSFIGPNGQTVKVPLKPLTVLTGPEGGHGEEAADDHATADTDDHATATDDHGAAKTDDHATGTDNHDDAKTDDHAAATDDHATETNDHAAATDDHAAGYNARGKAKLDQTGQWTAVFEIDGVPEGKVIAKVPFVVEQGGPNRIFLAFSGLLMGGTMIYGAINRRSNTKNGR